MNTINLNAAKWSATSYNEYQHPTLKPITVIETYKWATFTWDGTTQELAEELEYLNGLNDDGESESISDNWQPNNLEASDIDTNHYRQYSDSEWNQLLEEHNHNAYDILDHLGYNYASTTYYLSETPIITEQPEINHDHYTITLDLLVDREEYKPYTPEHATLDLLADEYTPELRDYIIREYLKTLHIELPHQYIYELNIEGKTDHIRIHNHDYDSLSTFVSRGKTTSTDRIYATDISTIQDLSRALNQPLRNNKP